MNKICTTIEQSEKLIELGIDRKSSDMYYWCGEDLRIGGYKAQDEEFDVSAWSLAALFDVLPEGMIESYYVPNLQKENGKYSIAYGDDELLCIADNPINACYEMIIKLKESNIL